MLFTEMTDEQLEEYTKERCDEIEKLYDNLKRSIMKLSEAKDELDKFNLLDDISKKIHDLSYEHVDTLDRYLLAYESDKRLTNIITKLEGGEES